MFTPEFKNQLSKKLDSATPEAKNFIIDLLTESLLTGNLPEEHKVEVRIMKATCELRDLLDKCYHHFANPMPPHGRGQQTYPGGLSCQKGISGMAAADKGRSGTASGRKSYAADFRAVAG